jgi:hypothetical protein
MRYIKFYGGTPFCGTDYEEYEAFEDNITDAQLEDESAERSYSNASMYEDIETDYQIYQDDFDTEEEYEEAYNEASDAYYEECCGNWEEVSYEEFLENTKFRNIK